MTESITIFSVSSMLIKHSFTCTIFRRRPAWTDRILYKRFGNLHLQQHEKEVDQITCEKYQSHSNFTISDHKPVAAQFSIKVMIS